MQAMVSSEDAESLSALGNLRTTVNMEPPLCPRIVMLAFRRDKSCR